MADKTQAPYALFGRFTREFVHSKCLDNLPADDFDTYFELSEEFKSIQTLNDLISFLEGQRRECAICNEDMYGDVWKP